MKKIILLLSATLILIGYSSYAQDQNILTNSSVINMCAKKLPNSIILSKIKSSKNSFDVSTDALVELSNNGVPEEILNAIVEAASDESKHVVIFDPNDPNEMHDPGIYYYDKNREGIKLVQLESTIYGQNKSSGALASAMTYGLAKVKIDVSLNGNAAQLQLKENKPEFYIYFDLQGKNANQLSNWWFSVATSPNEFTLVKLIKKSKSRDVTVGSANISGASSGIDDKNKAEFKIEKISTGIYRIFFDKPLSGEYCFMYTGSVPSGYDAASKGYDFGVNLDKN